MGQRMMQDDIMIQFSGGMGQGMMQDDIMIQFVGDGAENDAR